VDSRLLYAVERLSEGKQWWECEKIVRERLQKLKIEKERHDVVFNRFVKDHFNRVKQ
jgi:hypothetical protein